MQKFKKWLKDYKITRSVFCFSILTSLDRNARNLAMSGRKFRLSNTCWKSALETVNYLDFQAPSITVVCYGNIKFCLEFFYKVQNILSMLWVAGFFVILLINAYLL